MTIIYERRQVNSQTLLVEFQFKAQDVKNGQTEAGCSLDKYISLDVWTQIYAKLESPLERVTSGDTPNSKSEVYSLRRAQLELRVNWCNTRTYHTHVVKHMVHDIDNNKDGHIDVYPHVLMVNIIMVSALDKYKKHHSQEIQTGKLLKSETRTSDNSNGSKRTSNDSSANDTEEYVPAACTTVASSLSYTPSTLSSISTCTGTSTGTGIEPQLSGTASEEYTPHTMIIEEEDKSGEVTYTPTIIGKSKIDSSGYKHKTGTANGLSRNLCPEKKKRTETPNIADLFGKDSDGELENEQNVRPSYNRLAKQSDPVDSPSRSQQKTQSNLNNWVTHRDTRKTHTSKVNERSDEGNKKRKNDALSPIERSSPSKSITKNKYNAKEKELESLIELRREFEAELKPAVTVDRVINLKDIPNNEIVNTFKRFRPVLSDIYKRNLKISDKNINPKPNEFDYLMILDALVTQEQQGAMWRKAKAEICKEDSAAVASTHENLLWKILVPEWALHIFMEKFELDRNKAIDHLHKQNQAEINNSSGLGDLDF